MGFPRGWVVKNPPANAGDSGSIPGLGKSPGGGNGNPLQYSCLENPMGRGSLVGYSLWGHKRVGHALAIEHSRQNKLRQHHVGLQWVLNPMTGVCIERKHETHREKSHANMEQRLGWCSYREEIRGIFGSWRKQGRILPQSFRRELTCQHLDFRPLQKCERINFCCFKAPSLWSFILHSYSSSPHLFQGIVFSELIARKNWKQPKWPNVGKWLIKS